MKTILTVCLVAIGFTTWAHAGDSSSCLRLEEALYLNALTGASDESQLLSDLTTCGPAEITFSLVKGKYYYNEERYQEASAELTGFLTGDGLTGEEIAEAWYYLGKTRFKTEAYPQAVESMVNALDAGYDEADASFIMGRAFYRQGDYETSNMHYQRVIELEPSNSAAWNNLGVNAERLGDEEESLRLTLIADSIQEGKDILYKVNILKTYRRMKRYEDAAVYGIKAHEMYPTDPEIGEEYALALNYLDRDAEAVVVAKKIRESHPEDPDVNFRIAYSYDELGQDDSAIVYYFRDLRISDDYMSLDYVGKIYGENGHFDLAYKYIKRSIEVNPNFRTSQLHLEEMLIDAYRFEEAYEQIQYIAEHFPDSTYYLAHFGYALMCLERYEEAIPYFLGDIEVDPNDTKPYNNVGRCFAKTGEVEKAFGYFEKALHFDPVNSYVFHNRASLYADLGEQDQACADLKIAMDLEYNWIIDSALYKLNETHCPEVNLNRKIIMHGFKNEMPQYANRSFIELIDEDMELLTEELITEDQVTHVQQKKIKEGLDQQASDFNVYPNPSTGLFTLENAANREYLSIKVFDMQSRLLRELNATNQSLTELDLTDQKNGTYIVIISDRQQVLHSRKIMVSR